MHLECHAMLGWVMGQAVPQGTPALRRWCVLAAVAPDLDGLSYLAGQASYERWHHVLGHNVFFGLLIALLAGLHGRSWLTFGLALASFGGHLLTDAKFSAWLLYLFWPLSPRGYVFAHSFELGHPVNIWLMYAGYVVVLATAVVCRRTPLELVSPALDRLVMSVLGRRTRVCHFCDARTNLGCAACGRAVCWRHGLVRRSWQVTCRTCESPHPSVAAEDSRPGLSQAP